MLDGGPHPAWEEAIMTGEATQCEVQGHSAVICAKTAEPIEMLFGLWTCPGTVVFLCYASHLLWRTVDTCRYKEPAPIDTVRLFSVCQWRPSCVLSVVDKCCLAV